MSGNSTYGIPYAQAEDGMQLTRSFKGLVAISVGLAVLGVVTLLVVFGGSSASGDIVLRHVTTEQLKSIGVELTAADGTAAVSQEEAERVVPTVREGGKVIETVLVNMRQGEEKEGRLAWAVNLDPASVTIQLHPPPGFAYPSPITVFAVVFVDAKTGELISAPALADPGGEPVKVSPLE
jgi:hypothetical protein